MVLAARLLKRGLVMVLGVALLSGVLFVVQRPTSGADVAALSGPHAASGTPNSGQHGYWLAGSDGGVFSFGSAQFYGSVANLRLQAPIVGITPTADRGGYWLVASDGGVFSFGDAAFYGSIPGLGISPADSPVLPRLNAPIVGMVPTTDGKGYFLVGADGGVFAFGDARFEGSCPGIGGCSSGVSSVMTDASGDGYWVVTYTGNVYAFGDATNYGDPAAYLPYATQVPSAVRTASGSGYWILFSDGEVYTYGDAAYLGSPFGQIEFSNPASAIFATSDGGGYWIVTANGTVYSFGDAPNDGDMSAAHLNGPIVAGAGT